MIANRELEMMNRNTLRALQEDRLGKTVRWLWEKSDFYRTLMQERYDDEKSVSLANLHMMPLTYRADLEKEAPYGLLTFPITTVERIHILAGQSGHLAACYTNGDIGKWMELMTRPLLAGGMNVTTIVGMVSDYGVNPDGLALQLFFNDGTFIVPSSYNFSPELAEAYQDGIHVWAGDYIPELSSSYVSSAAFNDIRHWYCTEGKGEYFVIKVTVAEAGVYEMAIHMRMKDSKERGTKYTVNEGTANEYTFETSFQFATDEDAFAARENDYTMSSYMFGIQVKLVAGTNTIKIQDSSKSPKNQHFRDFYFVKVGEWTPLCEEHSIVDGQCEVCGFIPVFENASVYDNDGIYLGYCRYDSDRSN